MSRAANRVTSFHGRFVEDVLDAEGGQRLVGVGWRRQVVQRTSPPVFHCITFGHFFGCHHWLCAEFMRDLVGEYSAGKNELICRRGGRKKVT